uniref:Uncharacterized protein LOC109506657 n=1 Tax=Elaeis guineensis var. tenera TaxID=51953 RepID=A0A6J0PRM2_ELAGV|nr:uncharacterized protein LOC109506657 [Elaeis guineensis]
MAVGLANLGRWRMRVQSRKVLHGGISPDAGNDNDGKGHSEVEEEPAVVEKMTKKVTQFLTFPSLRPLTYTPPPTTSPPSCFASLFLGPSVVIGGLIDSVTAIVEPALRHANVLFFKLGYNIQIVVDKGKLEEAPVQQFRRKVAKAV